MSWNVTERLTISQQLLLKGMLQRERFKFILCGTLLGAFCVILGAVLAWSFFNLSYDITG